MVKFFTCGLVLFIGSIYFTRIFLKNEKEIFKIDALPLLETNEAVSDIPFSGEGKIKEVEGNILLSPYTRTDCVYYHSITEELVRRGKRSTWEIVENLINFVPFYVTDKRGRLKIDLSNFDDDLSGYKITKQKGAVPDPDKSEIDALSMIKHQEQHESKTWLGFIPGTKKTRRSEFVLIPNTEVFVYGYISRKQNELVLHEHDNHPLIISAKTKERYTEEFYKGKNLIYVVHLLTAIGFTVSFISLNYFLKLSQMSFYLILYMGNVCILGSTLFTMYNRIATLRQRALTALSNIDIELKRRADLIPHIITLIKQYSHFEKNMHELITNLRMEVTFGRNEFVRTQTNHASLLAIIENYPQLKAAKNFQSLMKSLVDTEERIAYSRTFYNRNVAKMNTMISQFPFIIIALLMNFKQMDFITITSESR